MSTITVTGTMSADPELRFTQGGKPVCNFRFGDLLRRTVDGQQVDKWTNFNCEAWGSLGENIAASLNKGDRAILVGRMESQDYTNQQGEKRSKLVLVVEECAPSLRWATCMVEKVSKGSD